jgi:hypothetical protein
LKLLILKLKRMHFGPRSEKYAHDIQQLELRLEDLEANQAAAEPPPVVPATVAWKQSTPLNTVAHHGRNELIQLSSLFFTMTHGKTSQLRSSALICDLRIAPAKEEQLVFRKQDLLVPLRATGSPGTRLPLLPQVTFCQKRNRTPLLP